MAIDLTPEQRQLGQANYERAVDGISRRNFLIGAGAALGALQGAPFVHAQKRGGTIRIIPIADLKVLDPIWSIWKSAWNGSAMAATAIERAT